MALAVGGCRGQVKKDPSDPDRGSGPDRTQAGATQRQLDTPIKDHVAFHTGDRTDWHYVDVVEMAGRLQLSLHWSDTETELDLALFNLQGAKVVEAPQAPGQDKALEVSPIEPGRYFVRVRAIQAGDASDYTLNAHWSAATPEPVAEPEPPSPARTARRPPATPRAADTVEARVVSVQAEEGGGVTLFLDKGSADGVKVGTQGSLLDAAGGSSPLPNTSFRIIKVIDEHKSIGKSQRPLPSKSRRAALAIK